MKPNIVAIVEARMLSNRLYGKVLKKIAGKEVLKIIIERLRFSKLINNIVVATTKNKEDDKIVNLLKKNNYFFYRGSTNNVLGRIVKTAKKFNANIIIRVTGDNPLIDPETIDYMLKYFIKSKKVDYLTNNYFADLKKRKIALGLDVSIYSFKNLKKINHLSNKSIFRQIPTLYFYTKGKSMFYNKRRRKEKIY